MLWCGLVSGRRRKLAFRRGRERRPADAAAAVDLEAMGRDVVAGALGQLAEQILDIARLEVGHRSALRADDVVVMAAAGEPVLKRAVIEHDLAERPDVLQQPQRAEDGGTTDARRGRDNTLGGEMIVELLHRREQ